MLYLVFVLTFLCGILFYSLSPRDDQLKWDMHRAEGFIAGFLAQHQSAKDYIAAWLGVDYKSKANTYFSLSKKTEVPVYDSEGNPSGHTIDEFSFLLYAPKMAVVDVSSEQGETPNILGTKDGAIQTSVFCLNSNEELVSCNLGSVSDVYLASYSQTLSSSGTGRPIWWPNENANRQRRYESWRRAITHRTRGSYSCGVLTCAGELEENASRQKKCDLKDGKQWCIDNGQMVLLPDGKCAQRVPQSIINALGCDGFKSSYCSDAFFCISKIKNGPGEYYAPGLNAFYDAINNRNTGAEGERASKDAWADLIHTQGICNTTNPENTHCAVTSDSYNNGVDFSSDHNAAYFYGSKYIKIPVQVGDTTNGPFKDFTWTILLGAPDSGQSITFLNSGKFNLKFKNNSNEASVLLMKDNTQLAESQKFIVSNDQIVSLTVIGSENRIKIYVNTDEILDYTKGTWGASDYANDSVAIKTTNANNEYLYGIRYYTRQLTTENRLRAGQIELSELAQNFNVDSKRYGIGKVEIDEEEEGG